MKMQSEKGALHISTDVFTAISGYAANNCFGVKGMASRSIQDGLVHLLRREHFAKGVKVTYPSGGNTVDIDLHIVVEHGINIPETCRSIMQEVRYNVERITGASVNSVNICIDSIVVE
ncbi:MAG: Asp23/Gls24 family envelope stress response protein [Oscillospiraceae bacterium]|nr:Asp23/Gls24 family envelope stress response protein [Oscillospiraceae bacterium]